MYCTDGKQVVTNNEQYARKSRVLDFARRRGWYRTFYISNEKIRGIWFHVVGTEAEERSEEMKAVYGFVSGGS